MTYPDRLSAIKARLATATQGPWACESSPDGSKVYALLVGLGCVGFDGMASADIDLIVDAPDDLRWAVEEIDFLRRYIGVLDDLAYALDALRWALEKPARGRLERRRRAYEEARRAWLATPYWREGECQGGCRRYATHVFVIEQDRSTEREPCCKECGQLWLAARQTAIDAGWQPNATLRLEPLVRTAAVAERVLQ